MSTTVHDNPTGSRYEILDDGTVAGFAAYQTAGDRISFTHTEVAPAYEGKGLAGRLVAEALDDARRRGLAVVPLCPYVRRYISRRADRYLDLVPEDVRDRLGMR